METTKKKCKIQQFGFSPKGATIEADQKMPIMVFNVLKSLRYLIRQDAFNFLRWEYEDVSLWIYGNQRKEGYTNMVKVIWK